VAKSDLQALRRLTSRQWLSDPDRYCLELRDYGGGGAGAYDGGMPMRDDCRHFESRTYGNGETVRKCDLDLAPEAPWKCPDDCPSFTRRSDIAWQVGSQVAPPAPPAPAGLGEDDSIARLLDEAEDIINAAGPDILAELEADKRKGRRGRRKRRRKD